MENIKEAIKAAETYAWNITHIGPETDAIKLLVNEYRNSVPISALEDLVKQMEEIKCSSKGERNVLWTCEAMVWDLIEQIESERKGEKSNEEKNID